MSNILGQLYGSLDCPSLKLACCLSAIVFFGVAILSPSLVDTALLAVTIFGSLFIYARHMINRTSQLLLVVNLAAPIVAAQLSSSESRHNIITQDSTTFEDLVKSKINE